MLTVIQLIKLLEEYPENMAVKIIAEAAPQNDEHIASVTTQSVLPYIGLPRTEVVLQGYKHRD